MEVKKEAILMNEVGCKIRGKFTKEEIEIYKNQGWRKVGRNERRIRYESK